MDSISVGVALMDLYFWFEKVVNNFDNTKKANILVKEKETNQYLVFSARDQHAVFSQQVTGTCIFFLCFVMKKHALNKNQDHSALYWSESPVLMLL